MRLTAQAIHAFKWSILGEAATRLIGPLVFLVLARLLVPKDFGVVAAATVVISFSQAITDAGLGKALIQRQDRIDDSANAVFWLNLVLALAATALLLISAPAIAQFFNDPRIAPVIRVLSLQVPLAALCTVQTALLQRDLAFQELFWVRLLTAGLPALASIPLAMMGMGYWALVAGALTGQAIQAFALWHRSRWRPHPGIDRTLAGQLVGFGKWATLSGLLAWFYAWADAIIVGHYLGSHDMGLYRTGNAFVTMLFGLIFAPLLPVLYSVFSRTGHDRDAVSNALVTSADTTILLSLPAAALIVLWSGVVEFRLFGPEWSGLAPIIVLLAISQGLAWLVGINGEAYRAIGRPDFETWAMGLSILAYLCGYLVSIQHGLMAFVATRAGLVLVGIFLQLWIANRAFGLRLKTWANVLYKPVLFSLLSFGVASRLDIVQLGSVASAVLQSSVMILSYAALVLLFDHRRLTTLKGYLHAT